MDMSFKEKSTWISFFSTVAIFGYYFWQIIGLSGLPKEESAEQVLSLLIYVVILTVIVETLFQAMLSATNHKAAALGADERDKLLEYKSSQIGYTVLSIGVLIVLGRLITIEYNPGFADHMSSVQIPMLTAHMLMASFILSEVMRFGSLIVFYRKGM